jgi:hypothetical protein
MTANSSTVAGPGGGWFVDSEPQPVNANEPKAKPKPQMKFLVCMSATLEDFQNESKNKILLHAN